MAQYTPPDWTRPGNQPPHQGMELEQPLEAPLPPPITSAGNCFWILSRTPRGVDFYTEEDIFPKQRVKKGIFLHWKWRHHAFARGKIKEASLEGELLPNKPVSSWLLAWEPLWMWASPLADSCSRDELTPAQKICQEMIDPCAQNYTQIIIIHVNSTITL